MRRLGLIVAVTVAVAVQACAPRRDEPHARGGDGSIVIPAPGVERTSIEPGARIAQVALGMSMDSVLALLGPPTSDDAAMGKVWASWRNDTTNLDVYGVRTPDFSMQLVRQVRTGDSTLVTPHGVRVGSTWAAIRRAFPGAREVATVTRSDRSGPGRLLDDLGGGIALETWPLDTTRARCIGITVHERGAMVTREYLPAPGYEMVTPRP
jgi:hypothetical protein